jgi:hypothetical protein
MLNINVKLLLIEHIHEFNVIKKIWEKESAQWDISWHLSSNVMLGEKTVKVFYTIQNFEKPIKLTVRNEIKIIGISFFHDLQLNGSNDTWIGFNVKITLNL